MEHIILTRITYIGLEMLQESLETAMTSIGSSQILVFLLGV